MRETRALEAELERLQVTPTLHTARQATNNKQQTTRVCAHALTCALVYDTFRRACHPHPPPANTLRVACGPLDGTAFMAELPSPPSQHPSTSAAALVAHCATSLRYSAVPPRPPKSQRQPLWDLSHMPLAPPRVCACCCRWSASHAQDGQQEEADKRGGGPWQCCARCRCQRRCASCSRDAALGAR